MGLSDRLERAAQPKPLDEMEAEIALFEAKKGRIDYKRGFYIGSLHASPEDQQPFTSHVLFATTRVQDTSFVGTQRGEPYRHVPKHVLGHLYHSFPQIDEAESAIRPQPFRLKIPEFRGLKTSFETRLDLLNPSHMDEIDSMESMCVRAIALGMRRHLEGVPATIQDPADYLIEKIV